MHILEAVLGGGAVKLLAVVNTAAAEPSQDAHACSTSGKYNSLTIVRGWAALNLAGTQLALINTARAEDDVLINFINLLFVVERARSQLASQDCSLLR